MAVVLNQGLSISFEDIGAGPPVVLGHSFLCSGKMWHEQVPVLADRFRVLNLDFRGHGRSSALTEAFSLYDGVSDVVAVLDELGIEKAVWCGLSVGGMVALRAALICPERVAGLILLDTDAGPEAPLRKLKYYGMGLGARFLGIGPFLRPISRLMFGPTTRRENPTLVSEWKTEFSTVHVPSMLRGLQRADAARLAAPPTAPYRGACARAGWCRGPLAPTRPVPGGFTTCCRTPGSSRSPPQATCRRWSNQPP